MGKIIFGDEEDSGSFLVEAVDDARAQGVVRLRKTLAAAEERVDQRALRVPCPRMNGHARRLVDADDVFIFVENIERNGFRLGLERGAWLRIDFDYVLGWNPERIFRGLVRQLHHTG